MKRHFMKGLMALCAGVMTLAAASSLFVSCDKYDDSELREQISALDKRVQNLETLKTQLEALTQRVDALYTLKFQVGDNNELQYSFDGGKTWISTGVVLAEQCDHECPPCQYVPCDHECPEVSLVDNGDSVTIKVGDAEFTIQKPEQIVFELRAGKVYFESEGTQVVAIKSSGIEDITVMAAPKGWWAEINSEGKLEITAPDYESTQGTLNYDTWEEIPGENAASGYVKVHACGAEGKCMVGKLAVEVSERPLVVKAYGGNAYFTVAGTASWPPTFYYGVSTRESYEADVTPLLKRLTEGDWNVGDDYANNWGEEFEVVEPIADLLGEEPQQGVEYVVWAVAENYSIAKYTLDEMVYAYYSPLAVNITEVEAEKTAYNVTVNVEVAGAEAYVAVAMPATYCETEEDIAYQKEQMAMAMNEGQYYGQLYTENYSGSALDIAAETTYSMTGNYSPDSEVHVFILPLDGRAKEDYTAEDVVSASFTTAPLTSGGSINLTAKQVTEYMGKVYSYEIWDYVDQLITLDPYTELGVEVTPSATADWVAFYYQFLTPEQWADYGAYTEDVVDLLLEGYGMTPTEIKSWPQYLTEKVSPATTVHFVGFIVDKDGKYGELAHVELTSAELKKADFEWTEPYTTNLIDGVLKNTQTLQFTPKFEGGAEPASYKYVLAQTQYYNQYEGKDDAQMAEELFFSTSSSVKTISAEELANGVLYVEDHTYGYPYYFAIVPIDAEGNPGASAAILEYDCVFSMDAVVTEGAEFEATAPVISVNFPEKSECYPDNDWGEASYYGYAFSDWDQKYQFYYEINFDVTPAEGTEVCAVLVDADNYDLTAADNVKAGSAWSGSYGSWATVITKEEVSSSHKYYNHYEDAPAPNIVLVVSWYDANGTYYYREYPLQEQFQSYADRMTLLIHHSPFRKQYSFDWVDYAMMMGMESMPACIDMGVSQRNYFMAGINYEAIYGAEAAGMWMAGMEGFFEIEPTDETSGVITLMTADYTTGELAPGAQMTYSDYTETSCTFNCPDIVINNVVGTLMTETVTVQSQGIAM